MTSISGFHFLSGTIALVAIAAPAVSHAACVEGTIITCTASNGCPGTRECIFPGFGPCEQDDPSCPVPPPPPASPQIAGGDGFTLLLHADGSISSVGAGALGNGTFGEVHAPVGVAGAAAGSGNIAIAAGEAHALALNRDGTVWAWGRNPLGQLGDGTTADRAAPVLVAGLDHVVAIAAGGYHSLAVKSDGSVWAWGDNETGELGDGTTTTRLQPVQVAPPGSGYIAVAGGGFHSLGLKGDGSVWAWGSNVSGQLGDFTLTQRSHPAQVASANPGSGNIAIAAGGAHSMALNRDGSVWTWGDNSHGQLGTGAMTGSSFPVNVLGAGPGSGAIAISAGNAHSLVLDQNGSIRAFGANVVGELGSGNAQDSPAPVQPSGAAPGSGNVAIGAGRLSSYAINANGTRWAWGDNTHGQLDDGTTVARFAPVLMH